jgi:futalosine hydrolase
MNILIVCATHFEIKALLDHLKMELPVWGMNTDSRMSNDIRVDVLITGIGMVNTAFMVGRYSLNHFDLIINAGVCGAFDKSAKLGSLVNVVEDVLSELGAEDGETFLPYDQMGLPGKHIFYASLNDSFSKIENLPKVKGITVNTVHGNENTIERIKQMYAPDVESMEGAAFFAACEGAGKNYTQITMQSAESKTSVSYPASANYVQVRAISNYVEKRDKSKWEMPLAIKNLNDFLIDVINER